MVLKFKATFIQNLICRLNRSTVFYLTSCFNEPGLIFSQDNVTSLVTFSRALENRSFCVIGSLNETSETQFLFEVGGQVVKISKDGEILMLSSVNKEGSSSELFRVGSASSNSEGLEKFSWLPLTKIGKKIQCAVGFKGGLAVIQEPNFSHGSSLTIYNSFNPPTPVFQHTFNSVHGKFYMKTILSDQIALPFLKRLISEHIITAKEILFLADPKGTISILPIVADLSSVSLKHANFITVHYDPGRLVLIDVSPCGKGVIFLYESGKITLLFYCQNEDKIIQKNHYLSCKVAAAVFISNVTSFSLVFTNEDNVIYSLPTSVEKFQIIEAQTELKGIVNFVCYGDSILSWDRNGCLYEISVDSLESDTFCDDPLATMTDISTVGKTVEETKLEIDVLDVQITALVDEQMDSSQVGLKYNDFELSFENLSSRCFSAKVWSILLKSSCDGKAIVKCVPLEGDFAPQQCISVPLDSFKDHKCEFVEVFLVGHLIDDARQLVIYFGKVELPIRDFVCDLKGELLKICQKN